MCGIIGYTGDKLAQSILLSSLERLEYRGYDSAGIATLDEKKIALYKRPGKLKPLLNALNKHPLKGKTGIGHVRWATHGQPNQVNSHPHLDCTGKIALVHNGIVENYQHLKNRLSLSGHKFKSDTDTEVIVHLIEEFYKGNLEEAVKKAREELKGAYAIGVISADEPGKIVAARSGSPLIIGLGKGENFIASDVPAILEYTKDVIYLEDGDMIVLTSNQIKITDKNDREIKRASARITWDVSQARKNGHPHFMLKEILEQPNVLRQMIESRLDDDNKINFDNLNLSDAFLSDVERIIIVACGTAYHAGLTGRYILEEMCRIPVQVDTSSEFRYRNTVMNAKDLVIVITQSGETADTLAALREAKKRGVKVLAICNVVGSSVVRESDGVLNTHAGPEIGVASTKTYTAQLGILYLLGFYLSKVRGAISEDKYKRMIKKFRELPEILEEMLEYRSRMEEAARKYSHSDCFLYLARGNNFPNALEGALKLKEISYIHAEGYPAGEMKHGPIALIDEHMPVVCIVNESPVYDKMTSNIQEIKSRKGIIIALATRGDVEIKKHANFIIYLPRIDDFFSPVLTVLPLQLLAYHIAVRRGCDVDQPRNLAKSVTVE